MSDHDAPEDDGPRCGACSHRLSDQGWTVCQRCSDRLRDDLLECADRHARLTAMPSSEPGRYDKPRSKGFGSSPPGSMHIMAMRDTRTRDHAVTAGVDWCPTCHRSHEDGAWCGADGTEHRESDRTRSPLTVLGSWAGLIAEEREYAVTPPTDMDGLTQWLDRQGDWIARWPDGGELCLDVKRLRNALRSATGDPNKKPVAFCFRLLNDGSTCSAAVFAPEPNVVTVRCAGKERHEYSGADLIRLALDNEMNRRAS